MLDPDDADLLPVTVQWCKWSTDNTWGNESYAAPVNVKALGRAVSMRLGAVTEERQEGQTAYTREYLTNAVGISPRDKIIDGTTTWFAVSVETVTDEDGTPLIHRVQTENTPKG